MNNIKQKIGHHSQLCSVEEMRLCGGRGDGTRIIEARNDSGIRATVCADRCLDLYRFEYKGINLGFFSPAGYVSPKFYDEDQFLRSFTAGFFTTCGLLNVGGDCEDEGQKCVTHGRISNVPCENLSYKCDPDSGKITICGDMREAVIFGEKLCLSRCYEIEGKTVTVRDRVLNEGGEVSPFMLLYHCNYGYPLLDEGVELILPNKKTFPRDAEAEKGMDSFTQITAPESGYAEQCFFHDMGSKDGVTTLAIFNDRLGIGVKMQYSADTLDHFTQWKMIGVRDYVLGLEPGNCSVLGRSVNRQKGTLKFINSEEYKDSFVRFTLFERDELPAVRQEVENLL